MADVLVTGVAGCIGAWTARVLLESGHRPIGVDAADEYPRLALLGIDGDLDIHRIDLRDSGAVIKLLDEVQPEAVIHLAALQIPLCKADPVGCTGINVGALVTLLEAARDRDFALSYASSAAVYGPDQGRTLDEEEGLLPQTLYGVFKRTDEEVARIYHQDYGVDSSGLRPYVVYGPGRDQGTTSDVTVALRHAARGESFRIRFGGMVALQYAEDAARAFCKSALEPSKGAAVYNLRGTYTSMTEVVSLIEEVTGKQGLVTHDEDPLAIAADLSDERFQADHGPFEYRPLRDGLEQTIDIWERAGALSS